MILLPSLRGGDADEAIQTLHGLPRSRWSLAMTIIFVLCFALPVFAQEETQPVAIDIQKPDIAPIEPFPDGYRSLLFTPDEHDRVAGAARGRLPVPAATVAPADESDAPLPTAEEGQTIERVLHLSGIVYANPRDWSIWLNGVRITPTSQPDEVRGLRVNRDFIELQWYDVINKAVVPVRLRPQQRFSLDTHNFIPAIGDPVPAVAPTPPDVMPSPPPVEPTVDTPDTSPPAEPIMIDDAGDDDDWDDEWDDDEALLWDLLESDLP